MSRELRDGARRLADLTETIQREGVILRQREITVTEALVALTEDKEELERIAWAANRKVDEVKVDRNKQKTIDDQMRMKLLSLKEELREHQDVILDRSREKDKMNKEILVLKKRRREQNEEMKELSLKHLQQEQLLAQGKSTHARKSRELDECRDA